MFCLLYYNSYATIDFPIYDSHLFWLSYYEIQHISIEVHESIHYFCVWFKILPTKFGIIPQPLHLFCLSYKNLASEYP